MMAVAGLMAAACGGGGGSSSPTTPPASVPSTSAPSKLVVLDSGNFDSLVLAAPRPSLVKFQSPT
jgi:hypothetical protein